MTELNDHLKLLFARAAQLFCRGCGSRCARHAGDDLRRADGARRRGRRSAAGVTFPVELPRRTSPRRSRAVAPPAASGRARASTRRGPRKVLDVVAGPLPHPGRREGARGEAIEAALKRGRAGQRLRAGERVEAHGDVWRFSTGLHCPDCDIRYADPTPALFSFNSPSARARPAAASAA
jgi:excinuclease ABC subunit A